MRMACTRPVPSICQLDVEHALRPMHVAAAHVLQPILDQLHGPRQPAREIAREHRMLDAALDAVAAADVHVLMHAHAVERHAQGARDLVGELGHLDGGPYVQHLAPRVPARHHAEGLDRHGGAAAPLARDRPACAAPRRRPCRRRPIRSACRAARWSRARDAPACCPACRRPRRRAGTAAARTSMRTFSRASSANARLSATTATTHSPA